MRARLLPKQGLLCAQKIRPAIFQYMVGISPQPLTEGPYAGYHCLLLPLSVVALPEPDGKSGILAPLTVQKDPIIAVLAEGYIRHFMRGAMFKPLQVNP